MGKRERPRINWYKCIGLACLIFMILFLAACNVLGYLNYTGHAIDFLGYAP